MCDLVKNSGGGGDSSFERGGGGGGLLARGGMYLRLKVHWHGGSIGMGGPLAWGGGGLS